jgi:hypothetical protein
MSCHRHLFSQYLDCYSETLDTLLSSKPAKRPSPLELVLVARQAAILDASQLLAAYNASSAIDPSASLPIVQKRLLTVVGARRDTSASLSVHVADVLLETRVRDTAGAVRDRTASVLGLRGSEGQGGKERDESDGELHGE